MILMDKMQRLQKYFPTLPHPTQRLGNNKSRKFMVPTVASRILPPQISTLWRPAKTGHLQRSLRSASWREHYSYGSRVITGHTVLWRREYATSTSLHLARVRASVTAVDPIGLEPTTSSMPSKRSSQMSYGALYELD